MAGQVDDKQLRIAVPKGRMYPAVVALLEDAGIRLPESDRNYRPRISLPEAEVKILKPQNIVEMLHAGSRDVGFTGADWVAELDGRLEELLDTGLDAVRVVAAAPVGLAEDGRLPGRRLTVASEYERLTRDWIARKGIDARFVRSYGATEVFPPEDADVIVDNTATGATLRSNGLEILDEILRSSTRMYASPAALADPVKRRAVKDLVLLLRAVLDARERVMVETNVPAGRMDAVLEVLPCMREPTVSRLAGGDGYAVRAAVPLRDLPVVIPRIKARGGTDVVVTRLSQIVA